jgi:hypothetical protein
MTFAALKKIIKDIKYKDWFFHLENRRDCFLLQVRFMAYDTDKPNTPIELQHCRKWFVSRHACKAEIVRTAFKAIVAAEEHEVCENFRYRGARIHSPHLDPDVLHRVFERETKPFNKRKRQRK